MLAFLAFMAWRLKLLRSAEFLCRNGPYKAKKLQNFNKCSCGLVCGLWKFFWPFFIFLEVLDTLEVQWYTKIIYVSSISPLLPKTKPKFPFRYIVDLDLTEVFKNSPCKIYSKSASLWLHTSKCLFRWINSITHYRKWFTKVSEHQIILYLFTKVCVAELIQSKRKRL